MNITNVLVVTSGISLIGFIYWFFFGVKDETSVIGNNLDVLVDGGYKPSTIKIRMGQKTKLTFLRKDANSCLEEIVFPDFRIKKYLPVNEKVQIELTPNKKGEFNFYCGMNMFHGKVVVV